MSQQEWALGAELLKSRYVIEQIGDGIAVADLDGNLQFANKAWAQVHGYTLEEIEGAHLSIFHTEEQIQNEVTPFHRLVMESGVHRGEIGHARKDGTTFPSLMTTSLLQDEAGKPIGFIGSIRDISEQKELEEQIQQSLERRARQVQTSTEVAQEIAAVTALDELYRRVVTLVKERFGYSHVQIFRHDLDAGDMVVVEGYGQVGKKMKEAGHSLPYGQGVVGTAAATGQPVLAADTTHDPNWVPHPDLPDTQGELAVPIKLRDKVLGVLDVQSDVAGALGEEDQVMLQGLAGQIAIAIQNTQALEEANIFRQFAEASGQGLGMASLEGAITYANPKLLEMLGEPNLAAAQNKPFPAYYPAEFQPRLQNEVLPSVMGEGRWSGELALVSADGRVTPTLESFFVIRDPEGNPLCLADVITDITERKQIEAQIEAQVEERTREVATFRTLVENTIDGIMLGSLQGVFHYVNPAGYELYGYSYEDSDLEGLTIADINPEEMMPMVTQELLPSVMQTGKWQGEIVQKRQDGSLFDAHLSVVIIKDEDGQPTLMAGIVRDLREQKEAEREREERNALLNSILNSLPVGVWVADQQFNVLLTNKTQQDMMGREIVDAQGHTHAELYDVIDTDSGEMYDEARMPIVQTMGDGQPHVADNLGIRWPNGKIVPVTTWTNPLLGAEGQQVGTVAITQDITERKKSAEEQARLQQQVIQAQQRAIQELSTPVIPVMERILVMPLVGSIDSMRAKDIMRALLAGISEHRAKVVILDITGVPLVDSGVANHLNKTIMAARLKGARTIVTGITDAVAETVVDLGIDWTEIETLSDLQTGLIVALGSLGLRLAAR